MRVNILFTTFSCTKLVLVTLRLLRSRELWHPNLGPAALALSAMGVPPRSSELRVQLCEKSSLSAKGSLSQGFIPHDMY